MEANDDPTKSFVPLTKGTEVSQYRIIERIGSGGMGEVYLAWDNALKRQVALKFMLAHTVDDEAKKARFTQEAQAAARLDHPNIVPVHDVGEFRGRPFFAMAHVEGQSLWRYAKNEKLSIDRIVELAMQLCEGLQAAHEKGITHRDIKPSNILIDSHGRLRIVDFGLASVQGTDRLTKTGSTLGTVGYMSPEQVRGEKVDHRSDLFSMGVVLYELLSGLNPFKAESEAATMHAITQDKPQPLARFNREVSDELQRIIDKALAKDVSLRYQHADGMLSDLKRLKTDSGQPVTSKIGLWVAAAVVVLVAGYFGYYNYFGGGEALTKQPQRLVVLPFENLGVAEDEYFADGITDEITSRLSKLSGLSVISRTSSMQYKNTSKSLKQIGEELNVNYILEGTILWDKTGDTDRVRIIPQLIQVSDDRHLWSESYQRALTQIFALQAEIAISIANELDVTLLQPERDALAAKPTENLEAYNAYLRALEIINRPDWSQKSFQLALEMLNRAIKFDPDFALAYALLSETHMRVYRFAGARTAERLQLARSAVETALEIQPDLPEAHLSYAKFYQIGQLDYERANQELDLAERGLPNSGKLLHFRGTILMQRGKFEEAIVYFQRGLEMSPRQPNLVLILGVSHHFLRHYDEAERYYGLCISLSPDIFTGYWHKFFVYAFSQGDLDKAHEMLKQNPLISESLFMLFKLDLLERNYSSALERLASFPEVSQDVQGYTPRTLKAGLIYLFMGEQEQSHVAFDSARALLESKFGEFPDDHRIHSSLGIAYAGLGRKEKALHHGEQAVELNPVSKDAFDGPFYEQNLAIIYTLLGDHEEALNKIEYLLSIPSLWTSVGALRIDPVWDPLRDHPRFQALLEKYDKGN